MKSSKIGHYLKTRTVAPKSVIKTVTSYKDMYKLAFYYAEVHREYQKAISLLRYLSIKRPNYIPDMISMLFIAGKYAQAYAEAKYFIKKRKHEVRLYALLSRVEKDTEKALIYAKAAKYLYLAREHNDATLLKYIKINISLLEQQYAEAEDEGDVSIGF